MVAGKNLGRTKLTDISPKKTVEGALGGLASSVAVALAMWKLSNWPCSALAAAGFGVSASVHAVYGGFHGIQHQGGLLLLLVHST